MKFAVVCEDKPNSTDIRLATREAHLAYLKSATVDIQLAGPLLTDDGEGMIGSLFIIEADDQAAVQGFADNDPYSLRLRKQYGMEDYEPTDAEIRVARHAYYGSISYFDDIVGRLLAVLNKTGLNENTIIVVTTDHGDMMGERGLWYKKSFFEGSCKIPLIISGKMLSGRRSTADVSLVDLLPTLMDIAGDTTGSSLVEDIEGRSLWPIAMGDDRDWQKPVFSENLAEGATAPILMVKKDGIKFIHSMVDPDQLFDLENDPDELTNLAGTDAYRDVQTQMEALVAATWDVRKLQTDVELSQARRLFLRQALKIGEVADWDYPAPDQLVQHCLRAGGIYNHWAYTNVLDFKKPGE